MRFISSIGNFRFVAIHDETVVDSQGFMRTTKPGYTVQFKRFPLTPYEKELAREKLVFRGVPVNLDGTPIDPLSRASVFDTEDIEDATLRTKVEKAMLMSGEFGRGDGYILVEEKPLPAPWPAYDELTIHGRRNAEKVAEENLAVAKATGVALVDLVAYEKQNRNDERIVAAYEKAKAEQEAETPAEELVSA